MNQGGISSSAVRGRQQQRLLSRSCARRLRALECSGLTPLSLTSSRFARKQGRSKLPHSNAAKAARLNSEPCATGISSRGSEFPLAGAGGQGLGVGGPVVEGCGVEVRAVGPDKSMYFRVDSDLVEQLEVTERPEEFPGKNRAKIDHLLHAVIEDDAQGIRPPVFK